MSAFCDRLAKKKPYGEACDPFCQSSVGFFVAKAFGNPEVQSGSSFPFASMAVPCRVFVFVWFEVTPADRPVMTWMSSDTALPFGPISLLPLYVKPLSVSSFFAAFGLYVESSFDWAFTEGSVTHCGNRPFSPIASVAGA